MARGVHALYFFVLRIQRQMLICNCRQSIFICVEVRGTDSMQRADGAAA